MHKSVCVICLESSILNLDLNAPLENIVHPVAAEETITYLDCLYYCSKLDFVFENSDSSNICCVCAVNLEKTYMFLKQIQKAYDRSIIKEEYQIDVLEEEEHRLSNITVGSITLRGSDDECTGEDEHAHSFSKLKCGNSFPSEENIAVLTCTECDKKFLHIKNLRWHYRNSHKMRLSTDYCKICCKFLENTNIRDHKKAVHSNFVSCDQCDYQCTELSMIRHKRNAHSDCKYKCTYESCHAKYNCETELNDHLSFHRRKERMDYICTICKKLFSSKQYLSKHIATHKAVRNTFDCSICEKAYKCKGSLDSHMRIHKEGKTLQCTVCQKSIKSFTEMRTHMTYHTRDFQEMCDICGKKFAKKSLLVEHIWKHKGLKLKCHMCDRLFPSILSLRHHFYVHRGKPYTCRYCGKNFIEITKLRIHLKRLHDVILTREERRKCTNKLEPMPKICIEKYLVAVPECSTNETDETVFKDDYETTSSIFLTDSLNDN